MNRITIKNLKKFEKLFGGLSESEMEIVSEIVTTRKVEAGKTIITEGETGDELYLLETGDIDISKTLTIVTSKNEFGTKERSFVRISGDQCCFFGEMALFGNGERSATVKAVSECHLLVICGNDFLGICQKHPNIGYIVVANIALFLAHNLRKANSDIIKLTTALSLALSG